MSEKKTPEFKPWFHKFMVNFAMWVFPALGVGYGVYNIFFAIENGAPRLALCVIFSALLVLVSLFGVKVRFDLAGFRQNAPKLFLIAFLAAAAVLAVMHLLYYESGASESTKRIEAAGFLALWGIGVYRYYSLHQDLFVN